MKPAPFDYHAPRQLDQALELLAELGDDAKLLAGGQSLVPAMNFRLAQPAVLIDLGWVSELDFLDASGAGLRIGAMTRQRALEHSQEVRDRAPLLSETLPFIAHPQVRNRGTLGGSLAHADPAAELPVIALALDARLRARSRAGERIVPARDFFVGLFETALEPTELLFDVELPPLGPNTGWAFDEVARRHGDYALVGVASVVELSPEGLVRSARMTLLSVGERPIAARQAEDFLAGLEPTETTLDEAARIAAEHDIEPQNDIHASSAFRRHLARVLIARTLRRALVRARTSQGEP